MGGSSRGGASSPAASVTLSSEQPLNGPATSWASGPPGRRAVTRALLRSRAGSGLRQPGAESCPLLLSCVTSGRSKPSSPGFTSG